MPRSSLMLLLLLGLRPMVQAQEYGQFQFLLELNYVSAEKTIELYQVTAIQRNLPQDVHTRLYHRLALDEFLDPSPDV